MSKTVLIPNNMNPWECSINGVDYSYPAGTEQEVPDEVAGVIERYYKNQPAPAATVPPFAAVGGVTSWNNLTDKPFYEEPPVETVISEGPVGSDDDDNELFLPEATYEFGKIYTVEVDGVSYELEFVSAYFSSVSEYHTGFNLKAGSQGAQPLDSNIPALQSVTTLAKVEVDSGKATVQLRAMLPYPVDSPVNAKVSCIEKVIKRLDSKFRSVDMVVEAKVSEDGNQQLKIVSGTYDDCKLVMDNNALPTLRVITVSGPMKIIMDSFVCDFHPNGVLGFGFAEGYIGVLPDGTVELQ